MGTPGYRNHPAPGWDPAAPIDFAEAEEFLSRYHEENPGAGSLPDRLVAVRSEIERTGTTSTPSRS